MTPQQGLRRELATYLIAIAAGALLGFNYGSGGFTSTVEFAEGINFAAALFMRLLKMIIVPLVVATVVTGVSSIPAKSLGRLGGRTVAWYGVTTALAVLLGIIGVNIMKPGSGIELDAAAAPSVRPSGVLDVLLDVVPTNPFAAFAETFDLLSVIFFSILFGLAIAITGQKAEPLRAIFVAFEAVMMKITDWVLKLMPAGVFALVCAVCMEIEPGEFAKLWKYIATVAGTLLLHACVTIPLLLFFVARVHPLDAARAMAAPLLTAFSTASSSATLPVTIDAVERKAGVDDSVSGFVLPLGATINMDGTALYESVAAIFIAQAYGIDLSLADQLLVFLTATLAAVGAAGVPGAGMITMIIVLEAVGLPLEGIGLVVAVDRFLDMLRTAVNVWGDGSGAIAIAAVEGRLDRDVLQGRSARVEA